MGGRWKTALLVFLLAVTMSTAVLAAGGIGVSRLDRPVSQIPPAPDVSPFRVVDGITVTPGEDGVLPPVVAPPEFADSGVTAAPTRSAAASRGREPALRRVSGRPVPAPAAAPLPVPRPVPSGQRPDVDGPERSGDEPAVAPRQREPEPDGDGAAAPPDSVRPDGEQAEQDDERRQHKRNRAAGQEHDRTKGSEAPRDGGAEADDEAGKSSRGGKAQTQKGSAGAGRR